MNTNPFPANEHLIWPFADYETLKQRGIGRTLLFKLRDEGTITAFWWGNKLLYSVADIIAYIFSNPFIPKPKEKRKKK